MKKYLDTVFSFHIFALEKTCLTMSFYGVNRVVFSKL
jgi:hypothetical protein